MAVFKIRNIWDRAGISISIVCMIHCLLFPVVLALLPLWSFGHALHMWLHPVLLLLIGPTVFRAVRQGKTSRRVKKLLFSGFLLLVFVWILHDWLGQTGELVITLAASLLLIVGHWKNYTLHHICSQKL